MTEFLSPDFLFRNAILGGLGVALLCSVLGVYLVLRRLVLIGVALPQASAAGIAGVFWLTGHAHAQGHAAHFVALVGSLAATFAALAFLLVGRRRARVPAEWGVGALFVLFRRELLLTSFDPEFARTIGRNPLRYDALLYALLGGSIALGVMNVGPLVVFGFLVLPALAALRIAPGIASAFMLSALIAAVSFVGGFAVAYRADLPAGPVGVAVAAAIWGVIGLIAQLRERRHAIAPLVLLLALFPLAGCLGGPFGLRAPRALAALPRGSLPELDPARPIAVLPIENATGKDLRLQSANPLKDLSRALGDEFAAPPATVMDLLQQRASAELQRRGYAVVAFDAVHAAVPHPSDDALSAVHAASRAGLDGYVLYGTLRRFTITNDGLLLVRLEVALLDTAGEKLLWTGEAKRPISIESALTTQEVLLDAGGPIFAEAFGKR